MEKASRKSRSRAWAVLIALWLTLFGALKPIAIDETVYHLYASQILADPLDPLGFDAFWTDAYEPALEILVPPGLPYWLAAARALFGDQPWLWKLSLLPYALLLCFALRSLLIRFAPGKETPLLFVMATAPTVVPAFNLMLDIPALALALGALALFESARAKESAVLCAVAGTLAGLALLTKYTALAPLTALCLLGLFERRARQAAIAGGTAASIFLGWELWVYRAYGDSQLLHAFTRPPEITWILSPADAAVGWIALYGGLALPVLLLSLVSMGVGRAKLWVALLLASAPFAWIALLEPRTRTILLQPPRLDIGDPELNLFFSVGLLVVTIVVVGVVAAVRRASDGQRTDAIFLAAWLGIELLCSIAISPYLASRRVIGTIVAASIALGAAAARRADCTSGLRWVAAWTAALGLLYGIADVADSRARRSVHTPIAQQLERLGFDETAARVWFAGHWGFRFYAERRGYRPLIAGDSDLRQGDFVLIVAGVHRQRMPGSILRRISKPLAQVDVASPFPWSTTPSFYLGSVPMRRQPRLELSVRIHRVLTSGRLPPL